MNNEIEIYSYTYLPLSLRICNVESSVVNGNLPLNQTILGLGCPSYKQSNSTLAPAVRCILIIDGRLLTKYHVKQSRKIA